MTITPTLVRALLTAQFPQWSGLPLELLEPAGSDHVIYRLGDTLSVRLPRSDWADGEAAKEHTWLPLLAPHLPSPSRNPWPSAPRPPTTHGTGPSPAGSPEPRQGPTT